MESHSLYININYVGSSTILNPGLIAALQNSLIILANENNLAKVYFWGKILGINDDYFIAQGTGKDEIAEEDRKTFYSKDGDAWSFLPKATKAMRDQIKLAEGRFTGDPSYKYELNVTKKIGKEEDQTEDVETIAIKEEDRLASVIAEIDEDVRIVPRGAFVKTSEGQVVRNKSFKGLSVSEAAKLSSYMHFRKPKLEQTLLQTATPDLSIDFMDTIDMDIPKGTWNLQYEHDSGVVTVRSLLWPGHVFYHVPETGYFSSVYVGTGEKNNDLPL